MTIMRLWQRRTHPWIWLIVAATVVFVLVALVQHHLLLPETATRRDLSDPRTAANVAEAVGST